MKKSPTPPSRAAVMAERMLAETYSSCAAEMYAFTPVSTEGVEPMSHAQDLILRLREDKVTESDQHELFQSVAPQAEAGLYLVPKVIE